MRYETAIAAYDVMDTIHFGLQLWATDPLDTNKRMKVLELQGDLQGRGLDHPEDWLKDLLIAVVEYL